MLEDRAKQFYHKLTTLIKVKRDNDIYRSTLNLFKMLEKTLNKEIKPS